MNNITINEAISNINAGKYKKVVIFYYLFFILYIVPYIVLSIIFDKFDFNFLNQLTTQTDISSYGKISILVILGLTFKGYIINITHNCALDKNEILPNIFTNFFRCLGIGIKFLLGFVMYPTIAIGVGYYSVILTRDFLGTVDISVATTVILLISIWVLFCLYVYICSSILFICTLEFKSFVSPIKALKIGKKVTFSNIRGLIFRTIIINLICDTTLKLIIYGIKQLEGITALDPTLLLAFKLIALVVGLGVIILGLILVIDLSVQLIRPVIHEFAPKESNIN